MKSSIHPCLWFDRQAEEAARFYASVFPNSCIGPITRYGPGAPLPEGTVLTIGFELDGQPFTALNGGPHFGFSPAISLVVACTSQDEVDRCWSRLSARPEHERCGWLVDRYGVSWQIVPQQLMDMLQHPDAARRQRVTAALMGMGKLDIAALQQAFNQPDHRTGGHPMRPNPVVHFELPCRDRERAARFYAEAFGWQTQMLGAEMGHYVLLTTATTDARPGAPAGAINGGLYAQSADGPPQHPSVVVAVDDIDAAIARATRAGAQVLGAPMVIPGVGPYVAFIDTEGNRLSMLQPLPPPGTAG
jgi:predicted 3-demethylubiquinone-9 3-methyltransferase (glyoxalase superfamily)/predicted enzyme related to lactoylglutathione lyase